MLFGGDLLHEGVGKDDEVVEFGELFMEVLGLGRFEVFGALDAVGEDLAGGFGLASLAFAGDDAEDFPDVFFGFVEVLSFAFDDDLAEEAPADEFAQV